MSIFVNKIENLRPLRDHVLVTEMNFHERITSGGIVLPADDAKNSGIRPRWGRVFAIGPDQRDVAVGQYILVGHGRWTRGVTVSDEQGEKVIRRVDTNDILLVSDELPTDDSVSDKV